MKRSDAVASAGLQAGYLHFTLRHMTMSALHHSIFVQMYSFLLENKWMMMMNAVPDAKPTVSKH